MYLLSFTASYCCDEMMNCAYVSSLLENINHVFEAVFDAWTFFLTEHLILLNLIDLFLVCSLTKQLEPSRS